VVLGKLKKDKGGSLIRPLKGERKDKKGGHFGGELRSEKNEGGIQKFF